MLKQIAFRNTTKNWRHSLSALLSLSAAFVSLVLFDGYMDDVKAMYLDNFKHRQMLGDVLIENKNLFTKEGIAEPWKFWVKGSEQTQIFAFFDSQKSLVENFSRSLQFQGLITNGRQSQIFIGRAYDIERGAQMRGETWKWNTLFGLPLDQTPDRMSVLLGQGLAMKMGCSFQKDQKNLSVYGGYEPVARPFNCPSSEVQLSATTVDHQLNAVDLNLTGLVDAGYKDIDDRFIQTSVEAAQTLLNTDGVTFISVQLREGAAASDFIQRFDQQFGRSLPDLKAQLWQNHRMGEMYTKTLDFLSIFRNFIIVVVLAVSTLSILNTMVKIVRERTREIGTLRSLGFRSQQIVQMFLYESIYLSLIGSFIGCLSAILLTLGLNRLRIFYKAGLLSEPVAFKINFVLSGYLTAWALLMLVSILACFFSTRHILKSKVVDNLNYA